MALCIMSKCRGAGFEEEGRSYIPKNVGMRREWSEWSGLGERDSGKGVGGAARGHYGFMHNVEMSGRGF